MAACSHTRCWRWSLSREIYILQTMGGNLRVTLSKLEWRRPQGSPHSNTSSSEATRTPTKPHFPITTLPLGAFLLKHHTCILFSHFVSLGCNTGSHEAWPFTLHFGKFFPCSFYSISCHYLDVSFVPSILPLCFHFTYNLLSIKYSVSHSDIISFPASICTPGWAHKTQGFWS